MSGGHYSSYDVDCHEVDSCEYNDAESECDFERLMRELGIEV